MANKPVKPISLVDQVVEAMKTSILETEWKAGEKMPSESALAETYGVNRLTVRMALQKLSSLGVVETRVGEGSFVKEFSLPGYMNEITALYLKPETVQEVFALRALLEPECARLACETRSKEELAQLDVLLEEYERCKRAYRETREGLGALAEADMRFHEQICRMSHNRVFQDVAAFARNMIKLYILRLISARDEKWKRGELGDDEGDQHRQIYTAIAARDAAACNKAYLELIDYRL